MKGMEVVDAKPVVDGALADGQRLTAADKMQTLMRQVAEENSFSCAEALWPRVSPLSPAPSPFHPQTLDPEPAQTPNLKP